MSRQKLKNLSVKFTKTVTQKKESSTVKPASTIPPSSKGTTAIGLSGGEKKSHTRAPSTPAVPIMKPVGSALKRQASMGPKGKLTLVDK